ncbi:hypothetical protein B5F24_13705 [Bacteroides clarus]|jgi:hypothetical protein|uniref:DUF3168 domain-containing protein n=1 Tax=Bacteroides clarus TaxID=626929 RepID=A0A1Y4JJG7_9BACE|nr:hypothetical protein [Bacteroides clarus]OUP32644.1 hypothetical protein B5F24_13705 [Bacteroides clarus]
MITSSDAGIIVYNDCKAFGLPLYRSWSFPKKKVDTERVVVLSKRQTSDTYWNRGFIEVNFCVPDYKQNANLKRLNELERLAVEALDSVGYYKGSWYQYSVESHGIEEDTDLNCHFVNVKLLFEVLNIN